jgi:hypothetical protein
MRTDFSYSNTLGWNTFPVPTLTEQNKADLTRGTEDILLAREHYFPATLAQSLARESPICITPIAMMSSAIAIMR